MYTIQVALRSIQYLTFLYSIRLRYVKRVAMKMDVFMRVIARKESPFKRLLRSLYMYMLSFITWQ